MLQDNMDYKLDYEFHPPRPEVICHKLKVSLMHNLAEYFIIDSDSIYVPIMQPLPNLLILPLDHYNNPLFQVAVSFSTTDNEILYNYCIMI